MALYFHNIRFRKLPFIWAKILQFLNVFLKFRTSGNNESHSFPAVSEEKNEVTRVLSEWWMWVVISVTAVVTLSVLSTVICILVIRVSFLTIFKHKKTLYSFDPVRCN